MLLSISAAGAATPADVRRVLSVLGAAGEEYREAMEGGRIVRPVEYDEATAFLADVRLRLRGLEIEENERVRIDTDLAAAAQALQRLDPVEEVVALLMAARHKIVVATGVDEDVYPPGAPSLQRGRLLFAENCAGCHGADADGRGPDAAKLQPRPSNFRDASFMRGETPYDFFHVISLGRRNTAMPAWGEALSVQERWDLVALLWSVALGRNSIAEGQGVYLSHCASCHGAKGDGKGAYSGELVKPAPDLSHTQALAKKTDGELFHTASAGVAGAPMPGFARTLDEDERWRAVAFLRMLSLGGPDSGTAADISGSNAAAPRRFGGLLGMLDGAYAEGVKDGGVADANKLAEAQTLATQVSVQITGIATLMAAVSPDAARRASALGVQIVETVRARADNATLQSATRELRDLIDTTFAESDAAGNVATAGADAAQAALERSAQLLADALAAYRRGDTQATLLMSDAYFEFEPLERRLGATVPRLKSQVEERFGQLRQQLRLPNNEAAIEDTLAAIHRDYAEVRAALQPQSSSYGVLLQSAGIILREGFEVVLVIGALAAYVLRSGQIHMQRFVYAGTAVGFAASLLTAFAFEGLLRMNPGSADALEGLTMLLAAVVLFWVSYWLVSKAEADRWQQYIKGKVQQAVAKGSGLALAGAAFLAVYREGFETVLFYKALYASAPGQSSVISLGAALGALALVFVYVAFKRFQGRIPMAKFFLVTGAFLYAMAAIFAGQGVNELQEVGWISTTPLSVVPTLPLLGVFPTRETLLAQSLFVAMFVYAIIVMRRRARATTPAASLASEIQLLRNAVGDLRQAVSTATPAQPPATQSQLQGLVDRVEQALSGIHSSTDANPSNGKSTDSAA